MSNNSNEWNGLGLQGSCFQEVHSFGVSDAISREHGMYKRGPRRAEAVRGKSDVMGITDEGMSVTVSMKRRWR